MAHSLWTEERAEFARAKWQEGLSASQIAAALDCGISRSAVCAKIQRMGCAQRTLGFVRGPPRDPNKPRKPRSPRRQRPPAPPARMESPMDGRQRSPSGRLSPCDTPPHEADNLIPFEQRKKLMELEPESCRWPVGDPTSPDFFFCGALALNGQPYCPIHTRRSYTDYRARHPEFETKQSIRGNWK